MCRNQHMVLEAPGSLCNQSAQWALEVQVRDSNHKLTDSALAKGRIGTSDPGEILSDGNVSISLGSLLN